MANFSQAYEKMISNEGGYKLTKIQDDRGGQTYAGIARNAHPNWPGWTYIDNNDLDNVELKEKVQSFYKENFWDKIKGDQIVVQSIAETTFDFAVNAGCHTSVKLAQEALNTTPDGIFGPITLEKINQVEADQFKARYALSKIERYAEIVNKDHSQSKFLLGWINRTLREV